MWSLPSHTHKWRGSGILCSDRKQRVQSYSLEYCYEMGDLQISWVVSRVSWARLPREKALIWKQPSHSKLEEWRRQEGDSFSLVFFFPKFLYLDFPFPHIKLSVSCVLIIQFEVFRLSLDFIDLGIFVGFTISHEQGLRMGLSQPKPSPVTACVQEAAPIAMGSSRLLSSPEKNYPKEDANLQANVLYKKKKTNLH